jgi:hypothetical protein
MSIVEFSHWLEERRLDLHWSRTPEGDVCLTAIRGKGVWSSTAESVADAIELLRLSVESSWRSAELGYTSRSAKA